MRTSRASISLVVDWVLPLLVVGFSLWGLYMSAFEVGVGWIGCHSNRPRYAIIHILLSVAAISSVITMILYLWTLPADHDVPPAVNRDAAQEWFNKYPHECFSKDGAVAQCHRASCHGIIKPPRTHHCSVCQTCRLEWDHHCPWVGSCLTARQSKTFWILLTVTGLGVFMIAFPVIQPVLDGAYSMYAVSRADPQCNRLWWNWWGSYVAFGGPGGRWVFGTVLGYWVSELDEPLNPQKCRFGLPFMQPRIGAASTMFIALALAGFCVVLSLQMGFRLLRGQTTIEAIQSHTRNNTKEVTRYLWIPERLFRSSTGIATPGTGTQLNVSEENIRHRTQPALAGSETFIGAAFPIGWNERIYDLGVRENARVFWKRPVFGPRRGTSELFEPPRVNQTIINRIGVSEG